MTSRPLDNARWGFESNCFVCEPRNERGLRVSFFHDDVEEVVTGEFCLGEEFSGAPRFVHGGLVSALLDEAMAWAMIAIGGRMAVTREMTTSFERPVKVGHRYKVQASLEPTDAAAEGHDDADRGLRAYAHITDDRGRRCAEARGRFIALDAHTARDAIGGELRGAERDFLAGGQHQR